MRPEIPRRSQPRPGRDGDGTSREKDVENQDAWPQLPLTTAPLFFVSRKTQPAQTQTAEPSGDDNGSVVSNTHLDNASMSFTVSNEGHGSNGSATSIADTPLPADLLVTGERLRAQAQSLANWGAARRGARVVLTWSQKTLLVFLLVLCVAVAVLDPEVMQIDGLVALLAGVTLIYLISGLHKAWMLTRVASVHGSVTHDTLLADSELPPYTVLVPLHHEKTMLPMLIQRLSALDYPADRWQALLLIEADDKDTALALSYIRLPKNFQVLPVPPGEPKTKPRALNFGLAHATGDYVVVYDAEDKPEVDQLRKAASTFAQLPSKVICLQARLDFYNRRQSLLARLFALDYLLWYTMVLPGLTLRSAFIPLGGTSNHFRRVPLMRIGGWDPYNVTEDCDIGARIARSRLQVAMLDSVTGEEAVTLPRPWTRQRSRWIKGYMQTYLVHMRQPVKLLRDMGLLGWIDFNLLIGGTVFALLVNPFMWMMTILYIAGAGTPVDTWIQSLFPTWIYYPAILCQIIGNFLFIYVNVYASVRYKYYDLTPITLLGPFYWVLMSAAAWRALASLIVHPFRWNKTVHGVSIPLDRSHPVYNRIEVLQWWADTSQQRGGAPALSFVLPAYNEELNIEQTVRACLNSLDRICPAAEVIVVDDGSHDRTGQIIDNLAQEDRRVRPLHQLNKGYGGAVLTGIAAAQGHLLCYMDSDGQFDPAELEKLVKAQLEHPSAVVLGYRRRRSDTAIRRLNAWSWKQVIKASLGLRSIRDIDCGFKLFPTHVIQACTVSAQGAVMSAELLTKLQRMNVEVVQVPVRHLPRRYGQATGANIAVILRAFRELRQVMVHLRRWQMPSVVASDWASDRGGPQAAILAVEEAEITVKVPRVSARPRFLDIVSEARAMFVIYAAVLGVNLWQATQAPVTLQEGVYWQSLRALSSGYHLYTNIHSAQPPIFLRSTYPFFVLFGHTLLGARIAMVVFALVALLAAASVGRLIAGRWGGILAAAVLAANPLFYLGAHTLQPEMLAVALELIALALAAAAMRDVVQRVANPGGQFFLALASGLAVGLAVMTTLGAVVVILPVLIYLLTPLWAKRASAGVGTVVAVANVLGCLVAMGATLVAVIITTVTTGTSFTIISQQILAPEAGTLATGPAAAISAWTQVSPSVAVGFAALSLMALLGLIVAMARRTWAGLALGVWGIATVSVLLVESPIQASDLLMVAVPLSLLAGLFWVQLLVSSTRLKRSWRRTLARVSLAATLFAMVGVGFVVWQSFPGSKLPTAVQSTAPELIQALRAATAPHDLVLTDAPQIAALAGRSTPPQFVDISWSRAVGDLTFSHLEAVISKEHVRVVLFVDDQLAGVPGFKTWVEGHAGQIADFGSGEELCLLS